MLPTRDQWVVPVIVQFEIASWAYRVLDEKRAEEIIAFSEKRIVAPLNSSLAVTAAMLRKEYKLATFDAIVYATAMAYEADILTCDTHFGALPRIKLIAKRV